MLWEIAKSVLPWAGTTIALAGVWLLWGKLRVTQGEVVVLEALAKTLKIVGAERLKHIDALNRQLAERHAQERRDDQADAASGTAADFLRDSGR